MEERPGSLLAGGEDQPYASGGQWQYFPVECAVSGGPTAILCRATDAQGTQQTEKSPWNPGGGTGGIACL
ncbi:MAG: hypothetical protein MRJ92_01425 [Nitrospira sp.]|nr:hypothetical protein [Nitrospira sp.]